MNLKEIELTAFITSPGYWDKAFEFQVNYKGDTTMYSEKDFLEKSV